MKCNFRPFISEPAEITSGNSNNSNKPVETQVHEEARDRDDDDEDDSTLPETEDNRGRDDILSKITEDDEKEMLQQNRMLLELLFEQQAEWKKQRTRMLSEHNRSQAIDRPENPGNQSKIFKMVDPSRYGGGAKELDKILETLRLNFASHKHLFPRGDPDQVKYAVSFLDTWNNHPDPTQRQPENTDPSEWASDLQEAKNPFIESLEPYTNELQKMNGDKDRRLNSATNSLGDSNNKGKQGSLRKAAIRNVIFDHPSPNLRKTLPAIPIIPAPVIQNRSSPRCPVEAAMSTIYSAVAFKASL